MKKIYILATLLLLTATTLSATQSSKLKMVDSSEKSAPDWINNLERGYIISSASEINLEGAKQSVIVGVKQQIAQSIVSNVSVEYFYESSTLETSNTNPAFIERTEEVIKSTTDKIPYLQSISLSKVSEFYWEHYYDKKSGETRFDYYIKYPFSDEELDALVAEFNAKQEQLNATIDYMRAELERYTQIEDIAKNMGILRALVPEFAKGDYRIKVVDELVNAYRDQYKYISVEEIESGENRVVLQPFVSGRALRTSQVPTHKSNCADRITKSVQDGVIEVTYDDYVCRAGDDNWIDVTFKFGTYFVISKIYIRK